MSQMITTPVMEAATLPIAAFASDVLLFELLVEYWLWEDAFGTRKLFSDVGDEAFAREPEVEFFVLLPFELELPRVWLLECPRPQVELLELLPCFEVELRMASSASQGVISLVAAAARIKDALIRSTTTRSSESFNRRCISLYSLSKGTGSRGEMARWR